MLIIQKISNLKNIYSLLKNKKQIIRNNMNNLQFKNND